MNSPHSTNTLLHDFFKMSLAHATLALRQLFRERVVCRLQEIHTYYGVPDISEQNDAHVLYFNVNGQISAKIWIFLPEGSGEDLGIRIVNYYFPDSPTNPSLIISGFKEIGNIFVSAFLTGVSTLIQGRFLPSAPQLLKSGEVNRTITEAQGDHHFIDALFDLEFPTDHYSVRMVIALPESLFPSIFTQADPPPVA